MKNTRSCLHHEAAICVYLCFSATRTDISERYVNQLHDATKRDKMKPAGVPSVSPRLRHFNQEWAILKGEKPEGGECHDGTWIDPAA